MFKSSIILKHILKHYFEALFWSIILKHSYSKQKHDFINLSPYLVKIVLKSYKNPYLEKLSSLFLYTYIDR